MNSVWSRGNFVGQLSFSRHLRLARTVLEHHRVDSSSDVRAECVSMEPAGEHLEVVVVRHSHDDPFDDICVRKDADVHERRAPRVHAPERVE